MNLVGQYLLSVVAVALIVSVSNSLIEKRGVIGSILKLITGVALTLAIVSPFTDLNIQNFDPLFSYAEADASGVVLEGKMAAQSEISAYIYKQMQAYILDKATALGLDIRVDILLTDDSPPVVESIIINGMASPYAKKRLLLYIINDLGVTEDHVVWTQNSG